MMEARLAALEGAERCVAFASGMAAILATVMGLMKAGEHVVASRSIFGSTVQLFSNILGRFGIETTYVSPTDPAEWRAAVKPNTKLFFVESPSNPLTEVSDIRALAEIAHAHDAWLAVDNCFCSPALQQPARLGADLVVHSGTKYLDGQGRVIAGAVCGPESLIESRLVPVMRSAGMSLSPFNAWVVLKGMETLSVRMKAQSERALQLAQWLEAQPGIERVYYPGLPSHPQHALAMAQQGGVGGAVVAFNVRGGREGAFRVIDRTQICSITANLGDTKTTITHPATTSHGRLTEAQRLAAGITQGTIRVAVGLEDVEDLKADLAHGLAAPE
jgi:O-succinylhomoserine sulfhydrylase